MPGWPLQLPPGQKPMPGALWNPANAAGIPQPVGAWLLNDGAGLQAWDSVGNNQGTLTGGPTWVPTPYGSGLNFDGTSQWLDIPDARALRFTSGLTMEILCCRTGATDQYDTLCLKMYTNTPYYSYGMNFQSTDHSVYINAAYSAALATNRRATGYIPPLNTWVHLVFTYDVAVGYEFYTNGSLRYSSYAANGPIAYYNAQSLQIGTNLPVQVAKAAVYSGALPADTIKKLAADPFAGCRPSQQLWYAVVGGAGADYLPNISDYYRRRRAA